MHALQIENLGTVKMTFRHRHPKLEVRNSNRLADAKVMKIPGETTTIIRYFGTDGEEHEVKGISTVHPNDFYNKEEGRQVSLDRAVVTLISELTFNHGFSTNDADIIGDDILFAYTTRTALGSPVDQVAPLNCLVV